MSKDDVWANHQLRLGLRDENNKVLPAATAREVVETLRDLLLLAEAAMMEADDEKE